MELFEIEEKRRAGREDAAAWLRELADALSRHNQLEFTRGAIRYRIAVPDEIDVEVELEIDDDGGKLEIELSW